MIHNMTEAIKNRLFLFFVIIAFIVLKIPALHYPFYWDESWSYAPGVKLMYLHGPSLMPNAIDLFYSRGHPLLFYAAAATWMRAFGDSHISQHSFALFISILCLITIYEITLRLFNKRVAILSLLLVATQVTFFVQSTFILPEIMVAWLCLLTLYFYSANKYLLTFISCSALLLTKESGVALSVILGTHASWSLLDKKSNLKNRIRHFCSVAGAGVVIAAFFLLQKKLNGWYLFPEHISLIDLSWNMFKGKMRFCTEIIFAQQYRIYLFGGLMLLSLITAAYKRNIQYAYIFILGSLLLLFGGEYYGFITRRLLIPFVFAVFVYTIYKSTKLIDTNPTGKKFLLLSVFFLGAYLSFSCLNFFTNRYLISVLIIVLILAAFCFDVLLQQFKPVVCYAVAGIILLIAAMSFKNNKGIGDVDLGVYNAMKVQEGVINYFEQNKLYDSSIAAYSALYRIHLTKPYAGFLHSSKTFAKVQEDPYAQATYIIKDNIQPDISSTSAHLLVDYQQVFRIQQDTVWAEIYKRK